MDLEKSSFGRTSKEIDELIDEETSFLRNYFNGCSSENNREKKLDSGMQKLTLDDLTTSSTLSKHLYPNLSQHEISYNHFLQNSLTKQRTNNAILKSKVNHAYAKENIIKEQYLKTNWENIQDFESLSRSLQRLTKNNSDLKQKLEIMSTKRDIAEDNVKNLEEELEVSRMLLQSSLHCKSSKEFDGGSVDSRLSVDFEFLHNDGVSTKRLINTFSYCSDKENDYRCTGNQHHESIQNHKLRDEVDRLKLLADKFMLKYEEQRKNFSIERKKLNQRLQKQNLEVFVKSKCIEFLNTDRNHWKRKYYGREKYIHSIERKLLSFHTNCARSRNSRTSDTKKDCISRNEVNLERSAPEIDSQVGDSINYTCLDPIKDTKEDHKARKDMKEVIRKHEQDPELELKHFEQLEVAIKLRNDFISYYK